MNFHSYEEYEKKRIRTFVKIFAGIIAIAILISVVSGMVGVVPQNHVGVLIRAGVVQQKELSEGWKLKIPFVDKIDVMSNEVQTVRIATGNVDKPTTTETAETKDRQLIPTFDFEIQYQLSKDQSFAIYKSFGKNYETKLITNNATAIIKNTFALFDAEEIVVNKETIPQNICDKLNEYTEPFGVRIIRVNMKNYDFMPEYTELLEERAMLSAELKNNEIKQQNERIAAQTAYDVSVKESERIAETERIAAESAQRVALIQAEQDSRTKLIAAQADAEADRIAVDNEAYVTTTRAKAEKEARLAHAEAAKAELEAQASGLTELVVQRLFIEKWNGQLIPNFGDANGISFTNMTEIIESFLPSFSDGGIIQ